MNNIKMMYPSYKGHVTEIITIEQAVDDEIARAKFKGCNFNSTQDVIDNILVCPCTSLTDEPVGKTVTPYKLTE